MEDYYAAREWPKGSGGTLRREQFGFWRKWEPVLAEGLEFFGSFLRQPVTVGSVWPSSYALAREMIHGCNLRHADTVVELGAGTGAITRAILEAIGRKTLVLALELDGRHVHRLRRRFPGLKVCHQSAELLQECLKQHDREQADCVISALPWGNMRSKLQGRILEAVLRALKPGGVFTAMGYWHARSYSTTRHFRKQLEQHFKQVTVSRIVWFNVPPALVYRCR